MKLYPANGEMACSVSFATHFRDSMYGVIAWNIDWCTDQLSKDPEEAKREGLYVDGHFWIPNDHWKTRFPWSRARDTKDKIAEMVNAGVIVRLKRRGYSSLLRLDPEACARVVPVVERPKTIWDVPIEGLYEEGPAGDDNEP